MTKEIKAYLKTVNSFLTNNATASEKAAFAESMLRRIKFYQYERLIHLIVTALFAVLSIISLFASFFYTEMLILFALFLVLLVPYIGHYYFLENSVQKLYKMYYELTKPYSEGENCE